MKTGRTVVNRSLVVRWGRVLTKGEYRVDVSWGRVSLWVARSPNRIWARDLARLLREVLGAEEDPAKVLKHIERIHARRTMNERRQRAPRE